MSLCLNCMTTYDGNTKICPRCGYQMGTPPKEVFYLVPGTILYDRYIIGTVVGVGGFGIVYRAWDNNLGKMVAIKEYYPASLVSRAPGTKEVYIYARKRAKEYQGGLERFLEEARNMAKFSKHANIVNVYNFFEENNTAYFVMEYMDGISYKEYIRSKNGIVTVDEAINITMAVLKALEDIHSEGIIHRDIAPDNVMILRDGRIKLMDFGAARFSKGDEERDLTVVLKPGFAPEEQYRTHSKQGAYTDLYAVGAMLYRALTGVMPEESTNRKTADCLIPPRDLNPEIPERLNNIILRAMAMQPEVRFQSAEEFRNALLGDKAILNAEQEIKRLRKKRGKGIFSVVAVLLTGFAIGAMIYHRQRAEVVLEPAKLTVWVSAEEGEEENVETMYNSIFDGFREVYPQITIELRVLPQAEYADVLHEVSGTAEMPDMFESSDLDTQILSQAQPLDKLWKWVKVNDYYGLPAYKANERAARRIPVSFSRPVLYINAVSAPDLDVSAQMVEEAGERAGDLEGFFAEESEYVLASTMDYTDVQIHMVGKYTMQVVPPELQLQAEFEKYFSIKPNSSTNELNAEFQLLAYMLSENAQYFLCIQNDNGLPLNREEYATYVDVNEEFTIFEGEASIDFRIE